ncbi:hypothetical protein NKR17_03380 [Priestia flexa]|uniref:Uncharacterized protein n=1 Tax=Priestia flexa TaxID=86664 RepID=A0A8I1MJ04_9BACI|nr:hypothetical protein [Priestia flexa]MBN8253584.1 hypothetical protein [Priestia flexa]MCM3066813.1 hypothetical protein [Priestia flexa]MCP1188139.1 hypothetical protein [Priestia flexa]MED4589457.1 hypothetical protein [Priestia flexa]WEZ09980.1 hypothetical protein P5663_09115 [Priestia flexa]
MDLSAFQMTEEKIRKIRPIVEKALSRKYGKEIKIFEMTVGGITVKIHKE